VSVAGSESVSVPRPESLPPASEPVAGSVPSLDPRRATESILVDPGPPGPPGPFDGLRPRHPPRTRSELRPDGPAGFKTDEGVFVVKTARDGSVRFDDRPNLQAHVSLPTPGNVGRGIEHWYDSLAPGSRTPRPGQVDPDGPRIAVEDTSGGTPSLAGGSFDVTDSLLRGSGQDPYAARKAAFLDRTRGERMAMATTETRERLRQSVHRVRADLERLWRGSGSPAEKRRLLFQLWDECAETGSDDVLRTAAAMRGAITGFVRRRLPAGSRLAFTAAELADFNAHRTSAERFAPYAAPSPTGDE